MSRLYQRSQSNYCNKCQKTFYLSIDDVPDTCKHCGRHFCTFCRTQELQNPEIRYYKHDLNRCNYCLKCPEEHLRKESQSILNCYYGAYCHKCCISEDIHQGFIQRADKKRQILEQVKIRLQEDCKKTIEKIDQKIQVLEKIEPPKKKMKYIKDFEKEYSLKGEYDHYLRILENID